MRPLLVIISFSHVFIFQDFGGIFSMLLPGTNAKLMPPEGKTILDGLEVKVAFGDVWKESLTELSGGQRLVTVKWKKGLHWIINLLPN